MDLHLKQWRNQEESHRHEPPRKFPKLLPDQHQYQQNQEHLLPLPLFGPEQTDTAINGNLLPDSSHSKFPKMGAGYFSAAQWQELELQALIYRYMMAGVPVPAELLQPIRKSLHYLSSSPYFLSQPLQHFSLYHPALMQSGYWGKAAMDPEPGRCRRTDGKKWRCSRDVVAGQKYCERHVHRGRNRSRKPVETPSSTSIVSGATPASVPGDNFSACGLSPPIDLLQLNHRVDRGPDSKTRPDEHVLRSFIDHWPRSAHKHETAAISPSDVSLKLATGPVSNGGWSSGWASAGQAIPVGGPLAEALRSNTATKSPTSVLPKVPGSEATSFSSS